jgi:hypothetical protein
MEILRRHTLIWLKQDTMHRFLLEIVEMDQNLLSDRVLGKI